MCFACNILHSDNVRTIQEILCVKMWMGDSNCLVWLLLQGYIFISPSLFSFKSCKEIVHAEVLSVI